MTGLQLSATSVSSAASTLSSYEIPVATRSVDNRFNVALIAEWAGLRRRRTPRTALGKKLREIRAEIVASGTPLLSWSEVEREVAERRGDEAP